MEQINGISNGSNDDISNEQIISHSEDVEMQESQAYPEDEDMQESPTYPEDEELQESPTYPEDEELQESQVYSEDEGLFGLYSDYDFEPGKIYSDDIDNYQEDLYIDTSNEEHLNLEEGPPFCKFIDGEPGISAEPEELSGPQRVLQNVLIPCLHEYLQNYSSSENAYEELDEEQKALIAENRADLLDKLNYELLLDRKSWRLRSRFAEECLKLCRKRKITAEQVNHIICCFALTFMDDTINGVRIAGSELLAEIFSIFIEKEWPSMMLENVKDSVTDILDSMPLTKALLNDSRKGFLKSNSWRRRQTWANVLEFLTKNFEVSLQQYFFIFQEDLLTIANDGVRNTRIKFCQIFQSLVEHREDETTMNELFPSTYSTFQKLIEKMANSDSDIEIQTQAKIILGHLNPTTDCLDYDRHHDQVIASEDKMWKKFSSVTGIYLDDRIPKYLIEDFDDYKSPSSDEA